MIKYNGDSPEMFIVKSCYKNTISYLRDTLGLGRFLDRQRAKKTVQIIYGPAEMFGIHSYWHYSYTMGNLYRYNNDWASSMCLEGEPGSEAFDTYNKAAINYLKSCAKLSTNDPAGGMMFTIPNTVNTAVGTGGEELLFGDKRVYYVTDEQWNKFISMCN
jgi:hypothetical protein